MIVAVSAPSQVFVVFPIIDMAKLLFWNLKIMSNQNGANFRKSIHFYEKLGHLYWLAESVGCIVCFELTFSCCEPLRDFHRHHL